MVRSGVVAYARESVRVQSSTVDSTRSVVERCGRDAHRGCTAGLQQLAIPALRVLEASLETGTSPHDAQRRARLVPRLRPVRVADRVRAGAQGVEHAEQTAQIDLLT